jgi:hypothetical protein
MSILKVNTHIVDATPEYIEPVTDGNEFRTNLVKAVFNNHSNPQVLKGSSLEQRTQVFVSFFADENMLALSRFNVSGTANTQNIEPDSKSEAFKKWVNDHVDKSYLHPDEKVQDGNKSALEKGANESGIAKIENVVKSKL